MQIPRNEVQKQIIRNELVEVTNELQLRPCMLLDISASMGCTCDNGKTRMDNLRALVKSLPETKLFVFSDRTRAVKSADEIPDPHLWTNLAGGFTFLKAQGITNIILITDGVPSSEADALASAEGMILEIFYVGDPPVPDFLYRLAKTVGGTLHVGDLGTEQKRLQNEIKLLLPER